MDDIGTLPTLWLLIAAASPTAPAPTADAAGNRIVQFAAVAPARPGDVEQDRFALHCLADRRWCARLRQNGAPGEWRLELFEGAPADPAATGRFYLLAGQEDGDARFAIRPELVIEASGAALIAVAATRTTGFAGGGASATRLELVRAEPGAAAPGGVLVVPVGAAKDIRACFGGGDRRRRRGACSDQYQFAGTLTLDPATRAGRPRFLFSARATTYPAHRALATDSTVEPPLRRSDLRWTADPACSYRRSFVFDPAAGHYVPDEELPECADYLDF